MRLRIDHLLKQLSLARRFTLASLCILVVGMIGVGAWVGQEIAAGVVQRTAATTALYVDSFIAPNVQELEHSSALAPAHIAQLKGLLQNTPLGRQIAALKVWDRQGRILYSTTPAEINQVFPVQDGLAQAWRGEVAAEISNLQADENALERAQQARLLEIYSPVRLSGSDQIIAVAEFYQQVDDLEREITAAQQRSWLVVGVVTLVMYVLLAGFVQRASDTIARQQLALRDQVAQLTEVLAQNAALHERVHRAAARTTALNERFLRRISAELHDGPAQELGLALLRLDDIAPRCETCTINRPNQDTREDVLEIVRQSLRRALDEVRAISTGLGVPQLDHLTLTDTARRAVRTHERRTGTKVQLRISDLPAQAPLPVKITLYRVIQEALTNAYRHAGGVGQAIRLDGSADAVHLEVADQGPGFDGDLSSDHEEHLGLVGMRERVASLGGRFQVVSARNQGATIIADLSLRPVEEPHER